MSNEVLTAERTAALAEYGVTNEALAALTEKYSGMRNETPDDYKALQSGIRETRDLRIAVERKRKDLKQDSIEWGRMVDAEARRITDALQGVEQPMKLLKAAVDDERERIKAEVAAAEAVRVADIQNRLRGLRAYALLTAGKTPEQLVEALNRIRDLDLNEDDYGEFLEEATETRKGVCDQFIKAIDGAEQREREREEAERKADEQKKAAEEAAREVAEQTKRDAAEQAKKAAKEEALLQAERSAIEAERDEMAAEQTRLAAERDAIAKDEARLQAEREAMEKEKREREEAEQPSIPKEPAAESVVILDKFVHRTDDDGRIWLPVDQLAELLSWSGYDRIDDLDVIMKFTVEEGGETP